MWPQPQAQHAYMVPDLPRAVDALGVLHSSGSWSAFPGLMQTYLNDSPSLRVFLDALPPLPQQAAAVVCVCGGVDSVLFALRSHGHDRRVQASGLRAFTALVLAWNPFGAHPAVGAGGMSAAFFAMRSYGADAEVVEAALDALAAVVQGSGAMSAVAASSAGGVSDALSALRVHAASPGVCRAACAAIAYMVAGSPTAQASASGVLGWVMEALRTHAAPATQEAAVWALCNLADNCEANCGRARFVNAPEAVTRLLRTMQPDAAAQAARLMALLGAGGAGEVVAAMLAHAHHAGMQHFGIHALFVLAVREDERRAAEEAGAHVAVHRALTTHVLDATTRSQAQALQQTFAEMPGSLSNSGSPGVDDKDEAAGEEGAASVAVPLAVPGASVQFGTFNAAEHSGAQDAAGESAAAAASEPDSEPVSPEMMAHLDALMPWLRLSSAPPAEPGAPPPPPAEPPAEPPTKPQPPAPAPAANAAAPAPKAPAVRTAADEERETCVICLHERVCVALLPCRHFPMCAAPECAAMLGKPPLCPMCRLAVEERVVVAPPPKAQQAAPAGNAWKRGPPSVGVIKEPPPPPACVGGCGAPPCMLFTPCRHLALCGDAACAAKAAQVGGGQGDTGGKKRVTRCPACRAEAAAVTQLFLL